MIYKFNRRNVRKAFLRIIEDCEKCPDKEAVKINVIQEAEWLGYRINDEPQIKSVR